MYYPTLNCWLIMFLVVDLLCESQISTQNTTILDLGEALIIYGFEANTMLLKIYISLKMLSIISGVIGLCSNMYGSLTIFKYNLDLGKWRLSIVFDLIFSMFLIYFLIIFKSEALASLIVVIITLSLVCGCIVWWNASARKRHISVIRPTWLQGVGGRHAGDLVPFHARRASAEIPRTWSPWWTELPCRIVASRETEELSA